MSKNIWYVPTYRNAFFWRYRAERVKWEDFLGVCISLDRKVFWRRKDAVARADELNIEHQDRQKNQGDE